MNYIKSILFITFMSTAFYMSAQTSVAIQKAQKSMIMFLMDKGIKAEIDKNDQSVCFKNKDVLYWITFEKEQPMIFTLNRRGYKTEGKDSYDKSLAVRACNEVSKKTNVKAYCQDTKVVLCLPILARSVVDFQGVFDDCMSQFDKVDRIFKDSYSTFEKHKKELSIRIENDSVAYENVFVKDNKRNTNANSSFIVVPQNNPAIPVPEPCIAVSNISIRGVDVYGNVISEYDRPIRKSGSRFIQARVSLTSSKITETTIAMKIVNPDGKTLVPSKNEKYSTITPLKVSKINKPLEIELYKFGKDEEGFWKAGEYQIEFYQEDSKIFSTTFNVL